MDWFLYDIGLRHERVNSFQQYFSQRLNLWWIDRALGTSRSLTTKLFSITYEVFTSFKCKVTWIDDLPADIRAIFLNIWKTFDKVWHTGLVYKMYGIKREVSHLQRNYLDGRM